MSTETVLEEYMCLQLIKVGVWSLFKSCAAVNVLIRRFAAAQSMSWVMGDLE